MIRDRNTIEAGTANHDVVARLRTKLQRSKDANGRSAASAHDIIQDRAASWNVRRKVAALLRKAFRVVCMGQQRSLGRLSGGGAAVTALLMSMGLMLTSTGAQAQVTLGGGTVPLNFLNQQVLDRILGAGNVIYPTTGVGTSLPIGIVAGLSTAYGGGEAIGFDNIAGSIGGFAGFAFGNENNASGAWGVGIGNGNGATASSSIAIGVVNVASGNTSIAMGRQSTASGNFSIAQGNTTQATGINAIALGNSAKAQADGAIAIGGGTNRAAATTDTTAAKAQGLDSVAIGNSAVSSSTGNVALGFNAQALSATSLAIGQDAKTGGNSR